MEKFEQSARKSAEGSEAELFHFRSGVESNGDHLGEAELALFGREHLGAIEVIGHGADAEGTFAEVGGIGIEAGSLHLDAQNTHLLPFVILFGSGVKSGIEIVGREDIANVDVDAEGFRGVLCGREQGKIGNGGEAVDAEIFNIIGGGAGTLGENHIQKLQIVLQAACRTDTDNIIYIIFFVELPAVDADGRDAHAGGHDGDGDVLPGASDAHDAAYIVDQGAMFQKCFSNKLRTAGIAGHENGFRDAIDRCFIMGGRHRSNPPSYGCVPELR